MNGRSVAIVSAVRTAIGKFGGALQGFSAPDLGSIVIREALQRAATAPETADEVIMGNVYQAGIGPNPARVAALNADLPHGVPAMTVNKVCGSGLKAITLAAQAIALGDADCIVAGGMESMSNAPYLLQQGRWGARMGHSQMVDTMLSDGLWDCFEDCHMGITAENLADQYRVPRAEQDRFALQSQTRYQAAQAADAFAEEIVAVPVPQRKAPAIEFKTDEPPRATSAEALQGLRPVFKGDGTVTAGNASSISDGAAAAVLMSADLAAERGLQPLGYIRGYATAGVAPRIMGIGPAYAIRKLLAAQSLALPDVDLIEVNEAFAGQVLAVGCELGGDWDEQRVNVNGGAIALGHPIGASGTRIVATLLNAMRHRGAHRGIAALCIGGGMGIAALLEAA